MRKFPSCIQKPRGVYHSPVVLYPRCEVLRLVFWTWSQKTHTKTKNFLIFFKFFLGETFDLLLFYLNYCEDLVLCKRILLMFSEDNLLLPFLLVLEQKLFFKMSEIRFSGIDIPVGVGQIGQHSPNCLLGCEHGKSLQRSLLQITFPASQRHSTQDIIPKGPMTGCHVDLSS